MINNKTEKVFSYDNINDYGVSSYSVIFENNINSNELIDLFKKYKNDYLITSIKLIDDKEYNLSCNIISKCINDIYKQETNDFNNKHINGITISNITIISYANDITNFLDKNNIYYKKEEAN